jgi:hypothetical protein
MHILKKELTGLRVTVLFCFVGLLVQSRPHEGGHVQIIQILIKYTGCTYSKCSTGKIPAGFKSFKISIFFHSKSVLKQLAILCSFDGRWICFLYNENEFQRFCTPRREQMDDEFSVV